MSSVGSESARVEVRVKGPESVAEGVIEALRCGLDVASVDGPHTNRPELSTRYVLNVALPQAAGTNTKPVDPWETEFEALLDAVEDASSAGGRRG